LEHPESALPHPGPAAASPGRIPPHRAEAVGTFRFALDGVKCPSSHFGGFCPTICVVPFAGKKKNKTKTKTKHSNKPTQAIFFLDKSVVLSPRFPISEGNEGLIGHCEAQCDSGHPCLACPSLLVYIAVCLKSLCGFIPHIVHILYILV